MIFGAAAGMCTGVIHTKLKVNPLLADPDDDFALLGEPCGDGAFQHSAYEQKKIFDVLGLTEFTTLLLFALVFWFLLSLLLKTDFGLACAPRKQRTDDSLAGSQYGQNENCRAGDFKFSHRAERYSSRSTGLCRHQHGLGIVILVWVGNDWRNIVRASVTNILIRSCCYYHRQHSFPFALAFALASAWMQIT